MIKTFTLQASIVAAALLAWPLAQAGAMTQDEYKAAKTRIGSDFKAGKAACDSFSANAKDVCVEEAKAKEKVAYAELEYGFSGKPADQNKVLVVRAESTYAVAKERCDDLAGNPKDVCVQQAKAAEVKALADAKMGRQIGQAKTDAADEKRDADYKTAIEKCDAMSGNAKDACVSAAKTLFGKS